MDHNKGFVRYHDQAQQRPECNGLPLAAFLLTPIQRLPRYVLLLGSLWKVRAPNARDEPLRLRRRPPCEPRSAPPQARHAPAHAHATSR